MLTLDRMVATSLLEQTFAVRERVLTESVHDEMVILDLETTRYFGLNAVGALVWSTLLDGHTGRQAIETVQRQFHADADVIAEDVAELLRSLINEGLLVSTTA